MCKKKITVTNLVNSTQNAFLSILYVWTMYLWKLPENQRVSRLCVKWFHYTMLSLAPNATHFTESTFHITQYMSLADNTSNLTLPHAYASSLSNMVLP
jgi:hypothetical protein